MSTKSISREYVWSGLVHLVTFSVPKKSDGQVLGEQESPCCGGALPGIWESSGTIQHVLSLLWSPQDIFFLHIGQLTAWVACQIGVRLLSEGQDCIQAWLNGQTYPVSPGYSTPPFYSNELTSVLMLYATNMVAMAPTASLSWFLPYIQPCPSLLSFLVASGQQKRKEQFPVITELVLCDKRESVCL